MMSRFRHNRKLHFNVSEFYIIAFLEGSIVMAIELLGVRILTPYYGNTLFVWTCIIALTLAALSIGYYTGGMISGRYCNSKSGKLKNKIYELLAAASLLIAIVPFISTPVMNFFYSLGIITGVLLSSVFIIMLPLCVISCLPPILISRLSQTIHHTGNITGKVYAVSTMGGILITFLLGFFIIPEWGITKPILFMATILFLMSAKHFYITRKTTRLIVLSIIFALLFKLSMPSNKSVKSLATLVHLNEGVLGQIRVLDIFDPQENKTKRRLFINNISQSMVQAGYNHLSILHYVHQIAVICSSKPPGAKALQIGFGGGNICSELSRLGFEVDAVELDKQVVVAAGKYFYNYRGKGNIIIDDGRHYINTTNKKYDVIAMDVSTGEVQAFHNFTIESLKKIRTILNPAGLLIINYQGYISGTKGKAARSIYQTLLKAGFNTRYWKADNEKMGDILFVCSDNELSNMIGNPSRLNYCCKIAGFKELEFSDFNIDTKDAVILKDDQPILEQLASPVTKETRDNTINNYIKKEIQAEIPIYK